MKNIISILGAIIFASCILSSCGQNDNKKKELELKERELALKEREFALKEKELTLDSARKSKPIEKKTIATINQTQPTKQTNLPNKTDYTSKLIGKWDGYYIYYDEQSKSYKQGAEVHCEIIKDERGLKFIGVDGNVKSEDNVYLSYENGKFYGSYILGKYGGTHGQLIEIKFTLELQNDNILVWHDSNEGPKSKTEFHKAR
jgi:outer membrane murein-binding lipoprotein Lpp